MTNKATQYPDFDPNGVGLKNGHFIGLPFTEATAKIILVPVPWDVTVSYGAGTSTAPANILAASTQLDLFDPDIPDAWKMGIYMRPPDPKTLESNSQLRALAQSYIQYLESGGNPQKDDSQKLNLEAINEGCANLNQLVRNTTRQLLSQEKLVGLVGGEHSVPLGYLEVLAEYYKSFGVLQIDAHMDLREAYENFEYSHASIFYNALKIKNLNRLVQVGVRDCCDAEVQLARSDQRVTVFFDRNLKTWEYEGKKWGKICRKIIKSLPQNVYISFDIDGLMPHLCPNTGTPVPGGLSFGKAVYLLNMLAKSGRTIIGFDLCETGGSGHEWDGNVAARILYKLSNVMGYSHGLHKSGH